MTDKELLELAAKAAGIEIRGNANKWIAQGVTELDLLVWNDKGGDSVWNPLTDDGDALRLAVKLKMDVFFHPSRVEAHIAGGRIPAIFFIAREEYDRDPYAATRRAIVRAAAEIGKGMV